MKISLAFVSLLLFCLVLAIPAHAQCPGGPSPCLLSFSLSPGAVDGDGAHVGDGSVTAYLPSGITSYTLVISGPGGTLLNELMACDPPSHATGYMSCSQSGPNASFRLWGHNTTSSAQTDTVVATIIGGTNSLSQSFTLNPVPTPWETPDQDPDMPCPTCGNAGNPINVTNGNTWIPQHDYSIPGLGGGMQLERTWNSLWTLSNPPETYGVFGHSWRSNFEERIQTITGGVVKYWKGNGSALFYLYAGSGGAYNLTAPTDEQTTLSFSSSTTLWTVTEKNGTVRTFNNAGYLTAITDRNGNTISISIDAAHSNRVASVTDAAGRTLTFNYANGSFPRLCTSVTDSVGTVASYTYDSSERLIQVAYPDGSQFNFTYNSSDLILGVTDSLSKVIEAHTYDSSRRGLTSQQANDGSGHAVNQVTVAYATPFYYTNTVYDSYGNGTMVTVVNTAQRHYLTAASGAGFSCATCDFSGKGSSTLDVFGYKNSNTDGNGNTTLYTYDSAGNMTSKSLPVGNHYSGLTGYDTWSYSYNSFGEVTTITDPLGHTTTNSYDTNGNLLSTTTPSPDGGTTAPSVTSFTYGTAGQLLTMTDPLSHTTTLAYYSTGLIHTITDAQSHVTTYAYDARGNRTSVTDANSQQTQFAYDSMNRLTLITYPDTTTVQFAYDNRGRRTSVTDQNSKVTSYAYDDANRLISVTDPASNTTTYSYDRENDLTDIADALGRHTSFGWYFGGVPGYVSFPSGYTEYYSIDSNFNITDKTDRNGGYSRYAYDYQNRLLFKIPATIPEMDYSFDAAGRLTQVFSYGTGTYTFTYDDMNRLTQTSTDYSFDSHGAYTVQYGYDAASNRTSMTDPQSGVTTYTYDSLNRLTNLQDPSSHNFGFSYDGLSRRTQLTRPNGVNSNYSYDNLSRLLSVLHQVGSTTLDGASYTYDNAGNRTSKTDYLASVTRITATTICIN